MCLLALFGSSACTLAEKDSADTQAAPNAEGDCDTDVDTDTDADVDTVAVTDTAVPVYWHAGAARVADCGFDGGYFGTDITWLRDWDEPDVGSGGACWNVGEWVHVGDAAPGCPQCAWSFELDVRNTVAEGVWCEELGRTGGEWDGFVGSWGFAELYSFEYGGYAYEVNTAVMYYFATVGYWSFLSYNYDGYGNNSGTAAAMSFRQPYDYGYYYSP